MWMNQAKAYEKRWIGLIFLGFSLLIISLDNTVLNLALPSIAKDLGASASELQWIVDAYVLVFAALLLTMGSLGDRFGRKKILQAGMIFFALCSLVAALSTSTNMLISARALMGIGGATILPSTLSILTATFRDPKERAQAIAFWAGTFALGTGIGPLLGGWLIEHFHWSSVFYINLPVVAIAVTGGQFFLMESRDENPRSVDFVGALLSVTGLFALVYGIIEAGQNGWAAANVLYAFGAAAVLLGAFGWWEWHSPNPMLPLRFFRNMSFTGANLALTLVMFAMFGSFFFLSQYFQSVQGYSPLQSGVRLLPFGVVAFVTAAMSARLANAIGTKLVVALGILVAGGGLFYMAQVAEVDTSYGIIAVAMCITALGMGTTMSPATNSIMGSLPVNRAGVGSAMNDTTRQVGGALGVAVLGTVMNSAYLRQVDALNGTFALPQQTFEAIRSSIQSAHIVAQSIPDPAVAQAIIHTTNKAFMSGMVDATIVAGAVMVVASLVTLAILPAKVRSPREDVLPIQPREAPEASGIQP
jgi:EmrB/QacA subfamily drug resistance transporter